MSSNLFPPPTWKNLKPLWSPTGRKDLTLVKIIDPDDLVTFGKYMNHSGGRYQKWICDTPIWTFLTIVDNDGWPHCTIHAKDREWAGRDHPDDAEAATVMFWRGKPPLDTHGRARFWVPSTLYDNHSKRYHETCLVDGREVIIMAAGHQDADPLWPVEQQLIDQWYETVRMNDA